MFKYLLFVCFHECLVCVYLYVCVCLYFAAVHEYDINSCSNIMYIYIGNIIINFHVVFWLGCRRSFIAWCGPHWGTCKLRAGMTICLVVITLYIVYIRIVISIDILLCRWFLTLYDPVCEIYLLRADMTFCLITTLYIV